MSAGQYSCALVVFAKAEVQSGSLLKVGVLEGCDCETEIGGVKVGGIVKEGVEREQLGPGGERTRDYRLDKGHLKGLIDVDFTPMESRSW